MIITVPNSILTTSSKKINKIDKKVLQVVDELKKNLINTHNPKGVGLAANQIGVPWCIFVTRPTESSLIEVFINPEIIWRSIQLTEIIRPDGGKPSIRKEKRLEGCLSIPNVWGHLKRPSKVKIQYMDINGEICEKEFSGFLSTIIQHETDHLQGILFTQRVLEQKRKLFRIEENEKGEEKLIEIEI